VCVFVGAKKGGFGGGGVKRALPTPPASQSVSVSAQRHQRISMLLREQSTLQSGQNPTTSNINTNSSDPSDSQEGPRPHTVAYPKRPVTFVPSSPVVPSNQ
jgi:hypothetical protein